ncbi:MAG: type II toxin-antitoxin system Phd/YefM family antitoxin [Spirochaetales bacterium]|nr:type II toxin-antitoxin system Phd/YefM family antitoxin [Spirochaetales bacterium]
MPQIVPIRDLKNTTKISSLCHDSQEPVFVTKNGYGDLVIMSMDVYERSTYLCDVYGKLEEAKLDLEEGRVSPADESLKRIREKYGI